MASDIEMGDADHLSDHDSLKSTIPSSENGEYDVEEILAEREKKRNKKKSQTEYLVKWLGYPLYRSSWEPKECFQSPQTFIDWEKKKAEIQTGKQLPFDLKSFDEEKLRWENETQERKEARRIRRKQRLKLHLFPSENESNHNAGESPGEQGNDSDDGLFISTEGIGSDDSVSYGSPAQSPRTTSTTSAQSPTVNTQNPLAPVQTPISTNLALEEPTRAIESNTQSAQSKIQTAGCANPQMAQGASPQASMTKKKVQNGSKNTQPFASQSLPGFGDTSTASFRDPVRRINTKWRGRDTRWGSDRAPDASQLQLLKPTEFTPLKNPPNNTHATKTQDSNEQSNGVGGMAPEIPKPSNTRPNDPEIVSDYRPTTHVPRSSVLSGPEPAAEPRNTKAMDPNTERFRPNDQIASRKSSSQFGDSSHLAPRHGPSLAGSPRRRSIPSRLSILEPQSRPNQMNSNGPISSDKPENLQGDLDFTEAEQISQMPVGKPNRDAWMLPGYHFWNKGEVYAHVFYGPAKTAVGAVRICGISNEMKFDLLKSKTVNSKQCELWFRDLCNVDLYGQLCDRVIGSLPGPHETVH